MFTTRSISLGITFSLCCHIASAATMDDHITCGLVYGALFEASNRASNQQMIQYAQTRMKAPLPFLESNKDNPAAKRRLQEIATDLEDEVRRKFVPRAAAAISSGNTKELTTLMARVFDCDTIYGFTTLPLPLTTAATQIGSRREPDNTFSVGTRVVVVVGEFPPTKMSPTDSGYPRSLVIHPGKRGVVKELDTNRGDLVTVQWDEQYWQEWTEPSVEYYLDTSKWFMSQTGNWIKWKVFASLINTSNLRRIAPTKIQSR